MQANIVRRHVPSSFGRTIALPMRHSVRSIPGGTGRSDFSPYRLEGVLLDDAVDEADGALDLERVRAASYATRNCAELRARLQNCAALHLGRIHIFIVCLIAGRSFTVTAPRKKNSVWPNETNWRLR